LTEFTKFPHFSHFCSLLLEFSEILREQNFSGCKISQGIYCCYSQCSIVVRFWDICEKLIFITLFRLFSLTSQISETINPEKRKLSGIIAISEWLSLLFESYRYLLWFRRYRVLKFLKNFKLTCSKRVKTLKIHNSWTT
jgi:hypothetical protein